MIEQNGSRRRIRDLEFHCVNALTTSVGEVVINQITRPNTRRRLKKRADGVCVQFCEIRSVVSIDSQVTVTPDLDMVIRFSCKPASRGIYRGIAVVAPRVTCLAILKGRVD